ncbi:MAG: putative polyphosphate/ATP-dependent NAD kinase [Limisphaerales bacterium]|jgi:predicted polyphosphate/ATP-dependent NAD kinase
MSKSLKVGLIVNPVAGLGGKVGLKGSDGMARQAQARTLGGVPRAHSRTSEFLDVLAKSKANIDWFSFLGLGAEQLTEFNFEHTVLGESQLPSTRQDTLAAARQCYERKVDLLVFVGGDGTAVDLLASEPKNLLCLGVPAGVKVHSAVFAVSPIAAAAVVTALANGELLTADERAVVDYDEREGAAATDHGISTKQFGYLFVPEKAGYLQHTKEGGREREPLVVEEICADLSERTESWEAVIFGPGGTVFEIKRSLGLKTPTLRGFDILVDGEWLKDVNYATLEAFAHRSHLVLSFTRNQGFLLGRGNLELTPKFLQLFSPERLVIVATRSKVLSLQGRPILIDSSDQTIDARYAGVVEITAGYEDRLIYRLQGASEMSKLESDEHD